MRNAAVYLHGRGRRSRRSYVPPTPPAAIYVSGHERGTAGSLSHGCHRAGRRCVTHSPSPSPSVRMHHRTRKCRKKEEEEKESPPEKKTEWKKKRGARGTGCGCGWSGVSAGATHQVGAAGCRLLPPPSVRSFLLLPVRAVRQCSALYMQQQQPESLDGSPTTAFSSSPCKAPPL